MNSLRSIRGQINNMNSDELIEFIRSKDMYSYWFETNDRYKILMGNHTEGTDEYIKNLKLACNNYRQLTGNELIKVINA